MGVKDSSQQLWMQNVSTESKESVKLGQKEVFQLLKNKHLIWQILHPISAFVNVMACTCAIRTSIFQQILTIPLFILAANYATWWDKCNDWGLAAHKGGWDGVQVWDAALQRESEIDHLGPSSSSSSCSSSSSPCAENDKIDVLATGASLFMGNYLPLLQKLLQAHKVVLNSPSPFNKNTHPLIFLRGSTHQKSESVNTQQREVI